MYNWTCCDLQLKHKMDHQNVDTFLKVTVPMVVKLAAQLPSVLTNSKLPLLRRGVNEIVKLQRMEICSLMANSILCAYPAREEGQMTTFPTINFDSAMQKHSIRSLHKLNCICNYLFSISNGSNNNDTVTFARYANVFEAELLQKEQKWSTPFDNADNMENNNDDEFQLVSTTNIIGGEIFYRKLPVPPKSHFWHARN